MKLKKNFKTLFYKILSLMHITAHKTIALKKPTPNLTSNLKVNAKEQLCNRGTELDSIFTMNTKKLSCNQKNLSYSDEVNKSTFGDN